MRGEKSSSLLAQLTDDSLAKLLAVSDYRSFILFFLKPHSILPRPLTYAELSRRAGFASRAFPRDVCLGHRSINAETLPKFIKALGLTGVWKDYFVSLVQKEKAELSKGEKEQIKEKIARLRVRLQSGPVRSTQAKDPTYADRVFAIPELPRIFSALGPVDQGSTVEEIEKRTRLSSELLRKRLKQMQDLDLVTYHENTQKYLPRTIHKAVTEAGSSEFFKIFFLRSMRTAQQQAQNHFNSDSKLFLQSSVSISSPEKLKQLKQELRELIFKFAEEHEDPLGSCVVDINVAMYDPGEI